jgi:hypothetical protein
MNRGKDRQGGFVCLVAVLLLIAGPAKAESTDAQALWTALSQPSFDAETVATVQNLTLERDLARLTLHSGTLGFAQPIEGRVFMGAFRGTGVLSLAPQLPLEKQQLAFHTGKQALEVEFSEAVFFFSDTTFDEVAPQVKFTGGDTAALQETYNDRVRTLTEYGLNWEPRLLKSSLAEDASAHAFFSAELKTSPYDWLSLVFDHADPEEVELTQFDEGRKARTIWSKFPAAGRTPAAVFSDPLARHDYRLHRYQLQVTVQSNAELQVEAEVELTLEREGERVYLFALDPNLRVTEITNTAGQPLTFFQPDDPKDRFFLGDYLVVASPDPFPRGSRTIHFRYAGQRVVRKEGAGVFFCQSFGWYPTYGIGRDSLTTNEFAGRTDFEITLVVPKKYEPVAVGTKREEKEEGDQRITRWHSEIPLAVAGFAFGDYKVQTTSAGNTRVEVYANKRADDLLHGLEVATTTEMPSVRASRLEDRPQVALGSLAPAHMAKVMAEETANSVRLFERYFGPYPYKKLAVANIPTLYSYGQGWPSLLYLWALSFLDSTQRHQLGIRDHVRLTDFFRAHETSHQWWGHAVGWKSYHDQWLSEGFAEFSGILYTLVRRSPEEYFRLLRKNREELLLRDQEGAVYEQIGPLSAGRRLSSAKHPGGYGVVVYNKGGWVLHMVRAMLYDTSNPQDPDAKFIAMMQDFTRTYHNQPASTEDFKAVVERHMTPAMDLDGNRKMNWFFDSWVYGTGIPSYRLQYTIQPEPQTGQFVLRGRLHQDGVPASFRSMVAVYLHQGKNFMRAGWLAAVGRETPFEVTLGFQPDKVTINEWEDVLATAASK